MASAELQIPEHIQETQNITREELEMILHTQNPLVTEELRRRAQQTAKAIYGNKIYVRGLIEFTNYCKNNCYYCGIRCSNTDADRYRLSLEQILSCCETGWNLGFRTFVLQGGEDPHFTDEHICQIVRTIKEIYPDCAVTLSIGEKSEESYQAYFNAGADRYLLRHETADEDHYRKLHPEQMSLVFRKNCLKNLKKIGYQTGCGFMVGSPGQTADTLYRDLLFRITRNSGADSAIIVNYPPDPPTRASSGNNSPWNHRPQGQREGNFGRGQCSNAQFITGQCPG